MKSFQYLHKNLQFKNSLSNNKKLNNFNFQTTQLFYIQYKYIHNQSYIILNNKYNTLLFLHDKINSTNINTIKDLKNKLIDLENINTQLQLQNKTLINQNKILSQELQEKTRFYNLYYYKGFKV